MEHKLRAGIVGATGMVGQRFATILQDHPWFIGVQFHPEFKSRPNKPQKLFASFISAALKKRGN